MGMTVCLGGLGVLAGAGARVLIGRLPRGARVRPPWCELALGVLWLAAGGSWAVGRLPVELLPLLLGVGWLGVAAGAVDLACRRLPDVLTLPALPAVLLLAAPLGVVTVGRAALGAAVLFGAHLTVRLLVPAALGAGDVKLAAPVGAALGSVSWPALVVGVALAAGLTGAAALAGLFTGRIRIEAAVPHGPAMLAACWAVLAAAGLGAAGATGWSA